MNFAVLVRQWQAETGIMHKVIAERARMKPTKFSAIATGSNPNPTWDTIQRIALGFGVTEEEFFAGPPRKVSIGTVRPGSQREESPTSLSVIPAQSVNHGPHVDPPVPETAADRRLQEAIAALRFAVDALNAVTARASLALVRRQAATARVARTGGRPRPRKHR